MTPQEHNVSAFDRLFAIAKEVGDRGHFEVAYHALMAALHAAEVERNVEAVQRIKRLGAEQERVIETLRPVHPLSHSAARERGTNSVYHTLQIHADTVRLRLEMQQPGVLPHLTREDEKR